MVDFLNWVQLRSDTRAKYWYLTYDLIYNTPRGEILQLRWPGDGGFAGHAAIYSYYELAIGFSAGCDDFTSPDNFPLEIAEAIKQSRFRGVGMSLQLLTRGAEEKYKYVKDDDKYNLFWDLFSISENRAEAWR